MLQNWLILLPELVLISFFPTAWLINHYRENKTAKTFFTLSKLFLLASLLFTIIFYNKSVWPDLWQNSQYTTLFKVATYLIGFVWFYLSSKWFLNKDRSSFKFYMSGMLCILLFGILLSSQNFIIPIIIVPTLCILTHTLILQHWDEERVQKIAKLYASFAFIFCSLLLIGCFILWHEFRTLDYSAIKQILENRQPSVLIYSAIIMIISSLLFMMAAAPFHFWYIGTISSVILPICGFLTLIPPFAYLSCLITLMSEVFSPLLPNLHPLIEYIALFSIIIGALSTGGQTNIRRLFAFSSTYNLGVMLLGIISFNSGAIVTSFIYTIIYVMAMTGIYTAFLALKSKGDYLSDLNDIQGLSEAKPYVSAAIVIFMISLIGIPPLLGFWGRISLFNTLILEERWAHVIILLVSIVFMANAYLQVIRTIYFEPRKNSFDRTDKAIYLCLLINLLLIFISILNPAYLLHDAQIALSGVN